MFWTQLCRNSAWVLSMPVCSWRDLEKARNKHAPSPITDWIWRSSESCCCKAKAAAFLLALTSALSLRDMASARCKSASWQSGLDVPPPAEVKEGTVLLSVWADTGVKAFKSLGRFCEALTFRCWKKNLGRHRWDGSRELTLFATRWSASRICEVSCLQEWKRSLTLVSVRTDSKHHLQIPPAGGHVHVDCFWKCSHSKGLQVFSGTFCGCTTSGSFQWAWLHLWSSLCRNWGRRSARSAQC